MSVDATIVQGNCLEVLKTLPDNSIDCCVTSPPYWGLRDYGVEGQLGLEKTPEEYVSNLVEVFREVKRVLRDDGTLWLNLGDSYAGSWGNQGRKETRGTQREIKGPMIQKVLDGRYPTTGHKTGSLDRTPGLKPKDLVGIPWRVAFALQADGWYLRQDIIWAKPNPMPESVKDRCTKSHEYIFLLSKSPKYYFDHASIKEKGVMQSAGSDQKDTSISHGVGTDNTGINKAKARMKEELRINGFVMRNKRSVWTVTTKPFKGAHFATFPSDLITPCILAGCPPDGIVLDPFNGAGTTGVVSLSKGRKYIGIELNADYVKMTEERLSKVSVPKPEEVV